MVLKRRITYPTILVLLLALLLSFAPFASVSKAAPAGWSTSGTRILNPAGGQLIISGTNWYGFETRDSVAHGMWSKHYRTLLDGMKQYGYNTVRIPYSDAMWQNNPAPGSSKLSACPDCKGKRARDIMALIVNYAGSIGMHVILDNHRSSAGNSAEGNGLWYTGSYPESIWIRNWRSVQQWVHGIPQTLGAPDTVAVNYLASDGYPIVLGYDLRNEPHRPSRTAYLQGATWGSGDGIDPAVNPNPNPFSPSCVATSTCHDWRLAAERAGTTLLGDAAANGWAYPLIFVEGVSTYPADGGTHAAGPYEWIWNGENLLGVNGNSTTPGAPVVLNAGGSASGLGPAVYNQVVYSAHDYGPSLYQQPWFNATTCYRAGCSASSLASFWTKFWGYISQPGGINPTWPGHASYPWGNTGHVAYSSAPVWVGEFGTGKSDGDIFSAGNGSQGQWFTAMVSYIQSSHARTAANDSGVPVENLNWTYWAHNTNDLYGLLASDWSSLANPKKEYSFLCFIQWGPLAVPRGTGAGQCGSTGPLPLP